MTTVRRSPRAAHRPHLPVALVVVLAFPLYGAVFLALTIIFIYR